MSDRSLKVRFQGIGPSQAADLTSSLSAWLDETVVQESPGGPESSPVRVGADQANPEAQSAGTSLTFILTEALVGGIVHGVTTKAIESEVVTRFAVQITRWWRRHDSPTMEIRSSDGHGEVLDQTTDDPEGVLSRAFRHAAGPGT